MNRSEIRYWLVTILCGSAVLGAWMVLPVEE